MNRIEKSDFRGIGMEYRGGHEEANLPWPMDATSLPTTLTPLRRISDKDTPKAADQIVTAIQGPQPSTVTAQQTQLINSLTTSVQKQMLHQIKTVTMNHLGQSLG